MIFFVTYDDLLNKVEKELGIFADRAPDVLSRALNKTARWTGRELAESAQKRYRVQKIKFAKEFKYFGASKNRLSATIEAKGKQLPISSFKIMPVNPQPSPKGSPPTKIAILQEKSPKIVRNGDGTPAFTVKFQNGLKSAVTRWDNGKTYSSDGWSDRKKRWPELARRKRLDNTGILHYTGPSVPTMLRKVGVLDRFIETHQPKILEYLNQEIEKQIDHEFYLIHNKKG